MLLRQLSGGCQGVSQADQGLRVCQGKGGAVLQAGGSLLKKGAAGDGVLWGKEDARRGWGRMGVMLMGKGLLTKPAKTSTAQAAQQPIAAVGCHRHGLPV